MPHCEETENATNLSHREERGRNEHRSALHTHILLFGVNLNNLFCLQLYKESALHNIAKNSSMAYCASQQEAVTGVSRWTQPVSAVEKEMSINATRQKKIGTTQIWMTRQLAEIWRLCCIITNLCDNKTLLTGSEGIFPCWKNTNSCQLDYT